MPNNTASLFPADRLILQTEDGRTVVLDVVSIEPTASDTELVAVVFKDLTPREAASYHLGLVGYRDKRYTYRAPKAWNLKIGDQPWRESTRVTVVDFPESFNPTGKSKLRDLTSPPSN